MRDQSNVEVQGAGKEGLNLQAYASDPSLASSQESQAPPDYESEKSISLSMSATNSLIQPFPAVMNAYTQWGQFKTFNICGASERDRLYAIELHTGYSGKEPLGTRPGMLLHNSTSSKGPILAAVGDESQLSARVYAFSLESIILMPPLQPVVHVEGDLITERLQARKSGDHVAFSFFINVGLNKKLRREQFEWRKIKKGDNEEAKNGGFKLVRLSSPSERASLSSGDSSICRTDSDSEIIALLVWKNILVSLKHIFTLRLVGTGLSGELGERWILMVVVTALRLWQLKLKGKTTKGAIAIGEKIRGK